MKNAVRLLVLWLMLLAIPFQGIASAAMLACSHDARPGAQQHAMAADADKADDAAESGHCHETEAGAIQSPHDHDHDGRCSACAACCMGAAIAPAPAIAAAPSVPARLPVAAAGTRPPAVDLDLPERPPRHAFA